MQTLGIIQILLNQIKEIFHSRHAITHSHFDSLPSPPGRGQQPRGQQPRGQKPQRTKAPTDKSPNGQKPQRTKAPTDKSPGGQKPQGTRYVIVICLCPVGQWSAS